MRNLQKTITTTVAGAALLALVCITGAGCAGPQAAARPLTAAALATPTGAQQAGDPFFPVGYMQLTAELGRTPQWVSTAAPR